VDLWIVSVFLDGSGDPLKSGNPLAVFPEPAELSKDAMQAIARTLNLSETTFVVSARDDTYRMRIFTPVEELGFAGHPTLGTAWTLRRMGRVRGDELTQETGVGPTPVRFVGDDLWLRRRGAVAPDLAGSDPGVAARLARALGTKPEEIGLEARELGRPGRLEPAYADAGERILLVPVRDLGALESCTPRADLLAGVGLGAYCFTAAGAGRLRARGFFPAAGIAEDPATGAAAAALGLFLADRLGAIEARIDQGLELGRPSRISVRARSGEVEVGGRCGPVLTGQLASG
jgi:trans-2,3-dihydro-3-hydroxyanthranilate isomerase